TALAAVLGAARGYEAFFRIQGKSPAPAAETNARLHQLAGYAARGRGTPARADSAARVRRHALTALIQSGTVDAAAINGAATDADAQVRRLAVLAAGGPDSVPDR